MNSECDDCLIKDTCSFDPMYTVGEPNRCYFKRTDDKLLEDTKKVNEYYVRQLTSIGEELIKNAKSIAGSERGIQSIYISATLSPDDPFPKIDVAKTLIPECLLGLYNTSKDE